MNLVPAAQYLRMSTEKQEYSIENQEDALRQFAQQHGYQIVRTYVDAGKSGLSLQTRPGLRQLLRDIVSRTHNFNVVLVYDVSRWGRFQDYDEAGHYEFICRSTGVPVLYSAEPFGIDASPTCAILKTLKRTMAAEFSRQLGIRVYQRKKALVQQGFRVGGAAPFGLRRVVIGQDGSILKILKPGSRKSGEHRILITLGPPSEVQLIRKIFRMSSSQNMGCSAIARELNRKGTLRWGHSWNTMTVRNLLTNPIYTGCNAWGRTSQKMRSRVKPVRPKEWIVNENAFDAVVSRATFRLAQVTLKRRSAARKWDNTRIVSAVSRLLQRKGELSVDLLERTRGIPGSRTIRNHFGGYLQLYELLGYKSSPQTLRSRSRSRENLAMRMEIERRIVATSPANVALLRNKDGRSIFVIDRRTPVSLYLCPMLPQLGLPTRWRLIPNSRERENISLVCLLDGAYKEVVKTIVFARMDISRRTHRLKANDPWMLSGVVLQSFEQFSSVVRSLAPMNNTQHVV